MMKNPPLKQCLLSFCLLLLFFAEDAGASKLCFQPPAGVLGLEGSPAWMSTMVGVPRTDLNEPRWSSPLAPFQSDLTGQEGAYRIQKSDDGTQLFVQIQTGADIGDPGAGDRAYFGISRTNTNGQITNPTARGVRIIVGGSQPTSNPKTSGLIVEDYSYDYAATQKWRSKFVVPSWVKNPAVWSKAPVVPVGSAVDWGIAFVVDLTALGISPADDFKVVVALNVVTSIGVSDVYTPPPPASGFSGNNPFVTGFPVASWQPVTPTGAVCSGGVILDASQLTATNTLVTTDNTVIVRNPGVTNTFHAQANVGTVSVPDASLLAEVRIANWGTSYAQAAWNLIAKDNGTSSGAVPNVGSSWQFSCDKNAGTKVCGLDPAPIGSQGVFARLNYAAGYDQTVLPVAVASAYRIMSFQNIRRAKARAVAMRSQVAAQSQVAAKVQAAEEKQEDGVNVVRAEINTQGIDTGGATNDIYLVLHQRNLPGHGSEPVSVMTHAMNSTRRAYFAPLPAPTKRTKVAQPAQTKAGTLKTEHKPTAEELKAAQAIPTQVDLIDRMEEVWPHVEVQPYFDNKKDIKNDSGNYSELVPMYPFTAFYEPKGEFYGYSQKFSLVKGAPEGSRMEVVQKRHDGLPEVLRLTIPKDKTVQLEIRTELYEEPLDVTKCVKKPNGHKKPPETHAGKDTEEHVKSKPWCTYSPRGPGAPDPGLLVFGLLAGLYVHRRRRGRGSC